MLKSRASSGTGPLLGSVPRSHGPHWAALEGLPPPPPQAPPLYPALIIDVHIKTNLLKKVKTLPAPVIAHTDPGKSSTCTCFIKFYLLVFHS